MTAMRQLAIGAILILAALPAAVAQTQDNGTPLSVEGKLRFHVLSVVGPTGAVKTAAYAGVVHAIGIPREWRLGAAGYGMRAASAFGDTGIRHMLAFGLDSALRTDPRYFPARSHNVFARLGHALAATVVTRTDSVHTTVGVARIASAVGAAALSNEWYPARYHTVREGFAQGGIILGFDAGGNLLSEFWPDVKKLFRHR